MEWDISAECVSVIMLNIIMVYSWKGNLLPSRKNQAFRACLLITYLSILTNILSTLLLTQLSSSTYLINQLLLHLNYIFTPLMGVVYYMYTLTTVFEQDPVNLKKHIILAGIPALLYLLCLLTNPLTHLLFSLDPVFGYERGSWVALTYVIFYIYVLFSVFFTISKRRNIDSAVFIILNFFPVLSAVVILFQLLYPNYILTGTAATSALLIIYLYLQNKQMFTDPLTGILNRQEFNHLLEIRMKDTAPYSILVLSLKGFRFINDHFSQKAGDVLLMRICGFLEKQMPTARVFRFSGDEFAIVCRDQQTCTQYHTLLIERMKHSWSVENFNFQIQYGIGILHVEEHNRDKDEIIKGLEYAVMLAKRAEDNETCTCTANMMKRLYRNEKILELLRSCIQENSFVVYYQPIYDLKEQSYTKAEALLRLPPHDLGQLGPDEFIPLAEENGLITEITYQVLRKTCAFLKSLQRTNQSLKGISVNFSAVMFLQQDLGNNILKIIEEYEIPANMLQIEITESMLTRDYHIIISFMQRMQEQGIDFLLDDFGTGYSNISNVLSLPVQTIKIDKSLLWKAMVSREGAIVLQKMCEAFHEVHQLLLVEGVENEEQVAFVRACGCRYIQGYYYAPPLPQRQAQELLEPSETVNEHKMSNG